MTSESKPRRARTRRMKDTPLEPEDWVAAATEILVKENVRGINLDKLCAKLGVTKGSFYWHFKKRSDLLQAMLDSWRRQTTLNLIQAMTRRGGTFSDRFRRLLLLPRGKKAPSAAAVEQSMRDWARRNDQPLQAIREVDQLRLNFIEQMFIEYGIAPDIAANRAYLAYCLIMGDSILRDTVPGQVDDEAYCAAVVDMFQIDDDVPSKDAHAAVATAHKAGTIVR